VFSQALSLRLAKCCRYFRSENNKQDESDLDDGEENEDGNYTVYECPGLAPVSIYLCTKFSVCSTPSPPLLVSYPYYLY